MHFTDKPNEKPSNHPKQTTNTLSLRANNMQKQHLHYFGLIPVLLFMLTGCGSASDDSDSTDTETELSCTTSTVKAVTVPEITYTEIDEKSEANDDEADAQLITTNTIVSGSMNGYGLPSDGDYIDRYVINVSEGDEFIITLEAGDDLSAVNFNMYLNDGTSANYNVLSENSAREEKIAFTVPAGMTQLKFFIDDYDGGGDYILTVTTPAEPVAITDLPTEECTSNFTGSITNAVDGSLLASVTINLREGEDIKTGEIEETTTTNVNGEFSFNAIDSQAYTVEVVISDFITGYYNIELPGEQTVEKKYSLSPTLAAGQMRIVLNWGATPRDLDSYLRGPNANGVGGFEVYYGNRESEGSVLDKDDVNGFGPETITIETKNTGEYHYFVKNFYNQNIATSGAVATIYDENGIFKQITIPSTGSGRYWDVFTLDGATYNEINTVTNSAP